MSVTWLGNMHSSVDPLVRFPDAAWALLYLLLGISFRTACNSRSAENQYPVHISLVVGANESLAGRVHAGTWGTVAAPRCRPRDTAVE